MFELTVPNLYIMFYGHHTRVQRGVVYIDNRKIHLKILLKQRNKSKSWMVWMHFDDLAKNFIQFWNFVQSNNSYDKTFGGDAM